MYSMNLMSPFGGGSPSGIWSKTAQVKPINCSSSKIKAHWNTPAWLSASIFKIPRLFWLARKTGLQIGLGELRLPQAPFAGANVTAGHFGGGWAQLKGRLAEFCPNMDMGWGVGVLLGGRQAGREEGGLGGEGETCLAPPQWQPCSLSSPLTACFTYQHRVQLFCSAHHSAGSLHWRTLSSRDQASSTVLSTCAALWKTLRNSTSHIWQTALRSSSLSPSLLLSGRSRLCAPSGSSSWVTLHLLHTNSPLSLL